MLFKGLFQLAAENISVRISYLNVLYSESVKVGTHEETSRRDLLQGLVPVTSTHTAHTKGPVSPISMRLVSEGQVPGSVYTKGLVAGQSNLVFDWLTFYLVAGTSRTNSTHEGTS